MTKKEFMENFEDLLEIERGTLNGDELLANITGWDSLTVMSFIAMVDANLGLTLNARAISQAESVHDLVNLVADKLEG